MICTSCKRSSGTAPAGASICRSGCGGACVGWGLHTMSKLGLAYGGCFIFDERPTYLLERMPFLEVIFCNLTDVGSELLKTCLPVATLHSLINYVSLWEDHMGRDQDSDRLQNFLRHLKEELSKPSQSLVITCHPSPRPLEYVDCISLSGNRLFTASCNEQTTLRQFRVDAQDQIDICKGFRVARDFNAYTLDEFMQHYGEERGQHMWNEAWRLPWKLKLLSQERRILTDMDDAASISDLLRDDLCIGMVVQLEGVTERSELNGRSGALVKFHVASGRWQIDLGKRLGTKLVSAVNLRPCDLAPMISLVRR